MFQVPDEKDSSDNSSAAAAAENCCEKIDYKKREVSSHATIAVVVAASQSLIGSKNRVRQRFISCSALRGWIWEEVFAPSCSK